ncbi:MAG: radical SAM protein [Ignavibacteria bacterium]|nr:radical SAM protein [Ignavibacteria bacterium]
MKKFFFNIYLSIWQRLSSSTQNKITEMLRYNFNVNTLSPKLPRAAVIDPINICNLDCPLCASKTQNYDKGRMSFETFKIVLDKIPSLKVLVLFNWGEPLLHPEIFQMIEESVSRSIYTITHSNFSLRQNFQFFERLIGSGLHQLVISADGASQETYERYRVKGRFDWVIENIKQTVAAKKNLRKRDPKIVWKFLVNKYNEHEIDKAELMARELGVEITFDNMGLADDLPDISFPGTLEERKNLWLPKNQKFILDYYRNENKLPINDKPCYQLFSSIVVNPDAKVTPCCWITNKDNVWGDLNSQSIQEIWHGENYKYSRSLFNTLDYKGSVEKNICTKCEIFKRVR